MLDRIAIVLSADTPLTLAERVAVVETATAFQDTAADVTDAVRAETDAAAERIARAREQLAAGVSIGREQARGFPRLQKPLQIATTKQLGVHE